jgi:hypothetical protein
MSSKSLVQIGMCLSIVAFTILVVIGSYVPVTATPLRIAATPSCCILSPTPGGGGTFSLSSSQFNCNSLTVYGTAAAGDNYAAVRIWQNAIGGPIVVDSFTTGHPSYYMSIGAGGSFEGTVDYPTQPDGITLVARVYGAPSASPNSYNAGHYVDETIQCHYGVQGIIASPMYCSSIGIVGLTSETTGYAAVRLWVGSNTGPTLIDSFDPGYPTYYMTIRSSGASGGEFNGAVTFPLQPAGTTLYLRVYRALSPVPGSYDYGQVINTSQRCLPTWTPTP